MLTAIGHIYETRTQNDTACHPPTTSSGSPAGTSSVEQRCAPTQPCHTKHTNQLCRSTIQNWADGRSRCPLSASTLTFQNEKTQTLKPPEGVQVLVFPRQRCADAWFRTWCSQAGRVDPHANVRVWRQVEQQECETGCRQPD